MRDTYTKHVNAYMLLKRIFGPLFRFIFNISSTPLPEGLPWPYLLVSNHTTDLDPVLVALSCKEHMYFVASEHVLRGGVGAWLLKKLFAPISRLKGGTDAAAAMAILRKLRGGASVCLFAEGNRSFNGLTGEVFPATGKMLKAAGCALVTFKLEGGYLSSPRWSRSLRRGRMKGYPVRFFTPEQLATMTPDEINGAIAEDIHEDAYAREKKENIAFKGRRLAEGLETALFICPRCGRLGQMQSRRDTLFCACGMRASYDEYGCLHGNMPFCTVTDWDKWQSEKIEAFIGGGRICADTGTTIRELGEKGAKTLCGGELSLYPHKLCIERLHIPLREIADMALIGRNRIIFTWGKRHCEIGGEKNFCARKYYLFYRLLKETRA